MRGSTICKKIILMIYFSQLTNFMNHLIWKNDSYRCNDLKGTDGTIFKPRTQRNDTLFVFEPLLCRFIVNFSNSTIFIFQNFN